MPISAYLSQSSFKNYHADLDLEIDEDIPFTAARTIDDRIKAHRAAYLVDRLIEFYIHEKAPGFCVSILLGYPSGRSAAFASQTSIDHVPAPAVRRNMQPKSIA
jgi:hypothetical protein